MKLDKGGRSKYSYKREAIQAAKDLCYDKKVIKEIENSDSDDEIAKIMHDARRDKVYYDI